jgi:hypothetical protein
LGDANLFGAAFDQGGQSVQDQQVELQRLASTGRFGTLATSALEALFNLVSALRDDAPALTKLRFTTRERGCLFAHQISMNTDKGPRLFA